MWKEIESMTLSQCYFHIDKGCHYILLVDDWMAVRMMMVTQSNQKYKKEYSPIFFMGRELNPYIKDNSETLYMISTSSKGRDLFLSVVSVVDLHCQNII